MRCRITASLAKQEIEDIFPKDWILDSAATHFFCADKTQFEALYKADQEDIRIANGDLVKSSGWKGTVRLRVSCKDSNQRYRELLLTEVVYAPALEVNLLSTWMLGEMGLRVVIEPPSQASKIELADESHSVVATLTPVSNLYLLDLAPLRPEDVQAGLRRANATTAIKPISVWHRRLGHLNMKYLRSLSWVTLGMSYRTPAAEK